MPNRLRYTSSTRSGEVSLVQEGPDALWRLFFGAAKGGVYGSPEGAVAALSSKTVHMPKGLSADDWQGPSELSGWRLEVVNDGGVLRD